VKDEKNIDKFDQVFAHVFKGLERMGDDVTADIPAEWLKKLSDQFLTDEEKAADRGHGRVRRADGRARQADQPSRRSATRRATRPRHRRHLALRRQWLSPRGIRIGQDKGRPARRSRSVDKREYKNLDDQVEARHPHNHKVALRRLRKWVRDGSADELDMGGTIKGTSRRATWTSRCPGAPQQDQRADLSSTSAAR